MEARLAHCALFVAALCSLGATYPTPNFVVSAATPDIAKQVGQAAEQYRKDLAIEWLGEALPKWSEPCPIVVKTGANLGAGGATTFLFDRGEVYGWRMNIQGSVERVLDSVLPHEVTHTLFASHFRQPLPRWADEGACTTVEHQSEKGKQEQMLIQFLRTGRGIPFSKMFAMKDYPADVMPLYSQGYSLATFLIDRGGKPKFLAYIKSGLQTEDWVMATRQHYEFDSLGHLQNSWLDWVKQGRPLQSTPASSTPAVLASTRRTRPEPNLIYRAQSEDPPAEKLVPIRRESLPAAPANVNPGPAAQPLGQSAAMPMAANPGAGHGFPGEAWRSAPPRAESDSPPPAVPLAAAAPPQVILEWRREEDDRSPAKASAMLEAGLPPLRR